MDFSIVLRFSIPGYIDFIWALFSFMLDFKSIFCYLMETMLALLLLEAIEMSFWLAVMLFYMAIKFF